MQALLTQEAEAKMPQMFDDQRNVPPDQRTKLSQQPSTFDPLPFEAFETVRV